MSESSQEGDVFHSQKSSEWAQQHGYPIIKFGPKLLHIDAHSERKIEAFKQRRKSGSSPPPITVFADDSETGRVPEFYVVDGNHRAADAAQDGVPVEGMLVDDPNYKLKGENIVLYVLRRFFGIGR